MASLFKVDIWFAQHSSGTKFYHVISFSCPTLKSSFALRQNGAMGVFTRLGNMTTGAIAHEETIISSLNAGSKKVSDKRADGYTKQEQQQQLEFDTFEDLQSWARDNLGPKAMPIYLKNIKELRWASAPAPSFNFPPEKTKKNREPDEPDHIKHADWGTW